MKLGFKPRQDEFFDLFKQVTGIMKQSAQGLYEILSDYTLVEEKYRRINELEHQADDVTTAIIDKLNKTLVTPMDREDIYTLASVLDDVIDVIQGVVERMTLYKTGQPSRGAKELARILCDCADVIDDTFSYFKHIRVNKQRILENATKINALESEADKLYRLEVAKLFEEEENPIEIIKWKEILEHLEDAVDHCEDIADLTKGAVLKYA